jgi:pyruvate ferredoxin oxidoreductase gamma subunit
MTIVVDEKRCIGCGLCDLLCPNYAFKVSDSFLSEVDLSLCTDCLLCLNCCPLDAIGNIEEEQANAV